MYLLNVGLGEWDGSIVNPSNPQLRDTQVVPANGHTVAQVDGDNPEAWEFHCHILWQLGNGIRNRFPGES
jgi:FtsP/CotA-like multicopper oxidase with cupredoxin domain